MIWSDKGFLLSKLAFQENSIIANFYTKKHGKCAGIIYGATSKKFKKGICFFCKLDKILLGLLEGLAKNVSRFKSEPSFIS